MRYLPLLVLLSLCVMCVRGASCATEPLSGPTATTAAMPTTQPQASEVTESTRTVAVGRPVVESPDFQWKRSEPDGHLAVSARLLEPHLLQVRLPGGGVLRAASRFTWVTQNDGIVMTVNLVQDVEPTSIANLLDQIEDLARRWDVELDEAARQRAERTRRTAGDNRRGAGSYTLGGASFSDGTPGGVFFTLRGGESGWWADVEVGMTRDELRRASADTQPGRSD